MIPSNPNLCDPYFVSFSLGWSLNVEMLVQSSSSQGVEAQESTRHSPQEGHQHRLSRNTQLSI